MDLFKMFYPLIRKHEGRWAKLFKYDFTVIADKFRGQSIKKIILIIVIESDIR
jgi:hypothetical protein